MARYTITHTCGHTSQAQIYGTNSHGERDRKQEWLGRGLCADCLSAERAEQSARAAAAAAEAGLSPLVGSPKQIAWAETLRAQVLTAVDAAICAGCAARGTTEPPAEIGAYRRWLTQQTQSRYWIDSRDWSLGLRGEDFRRSVGMAVDPDGLRDDSAALGRATASIA